MATERQNHAFTTPVLRGEMNCMTAVATVAAAAITPSIFIARADLAGVAAAGVQQFEMGCFDGLIVFGFGVGTNDALVMVSRLYPIYSSSNTPPTGAPDGDDFADAYLEVPIFYGEFDFIAASDKALVAGTAVRTPMAALDQISATVVATGPTGAFTTTGVEVVDPTLAGSAAYLVCPAKGAPRMLMRTVPETGGTPLTRAYLGAIRYQGEAQRA